MSKENYKPSFLFSPSAAKTIKMIFDIIYTDLFFHDTSVIKGWKEKTKGLLENKNILIKKRIILSQKKKQSHIPV